MSETPEPTGPTHQPVPDPAPAPIPAPPPIPAPAPIPTPAPIPGPAAHVASHAAAPAGVSRRWLVAGAALMVLGGGVGVIGGLARADDTKPDRPLRPPPQLLAAAATERALIADLDATTGGNPEVRTVIVQLRADHAAHLRALDGVLATYPSATSAAGASASGSSATGPSSTTTAPTGTPRTVAQLRIAEQRAARAAARRADALDAQVAALLASIAACEATHAELLA